MKRFKVRFNLSAGENFMKWKIEDTVKKVSEYLDPEKVDLIMFDCKLRNQPATAKKIFEGADKSVCAWVDCDDVWVMDSNGKNHDEQYRVKYNPRIAPYWMSSDQKNIDNEEYFEVGSKGRNLYIL